ncbi:MAG: hypothetical protein M1828_000345 [Chrysothrix sp. TS-e1954]|nr:MAG: hypothetical protein M1828_000345 [Chrysothrix sp. TS-e1954]
MEALVAVALASNVVSFLDFGIKLVSKGKELYVSVDSRTKQDADLEIVRKDFEKCTEVLKAQETTDPEFATLIESCVQVANDLGTALERLKVDKGKHAVWRSCTAAFKSRWSAGAIEELTTRLLGLREELGFLLIVRLSTQGLGAHEDHVITTRMLQEAANNIQSLCDERPQISEKIDEVAQQILQNIKDQKKPLEATGKHLEDVIVSSRDGINAEIKLLGADIRDLRLDLQARGTSPTADVWYQVGDQDNFLKQDLINTFWYRGIYDRYDEVEEAYEQTFLWILDYGNLAVTMAPREMSGKELLRWERGEGYTDRKGHHLSLLYHYTKAHMNRIECREDPTWDPSGLRGWLQKGHGIFWFSGKPGSGKSTVMKVTSQHQAYQELLQKWAGEKTLITPSFYFWRAGSELQRSHLGLLLSVLHQVFKKHPQLMHTLLEATEARAAIASMKTSTGRCDDCWTLPEVKRLVSKLTDQPNLSWCFLVDGLDEFGGSPGAGSEIFLDLAKKPNVKVLLSARRLPEFERMFREATRLNLHEWTQHDIADFVRGSLNTVEYMRNEAAVTKTDISNLVRRLLLKAEGVFIWAKTAVRTLVDGYQDGDTVKELIVRVEELPQELDDLYETVLRSLDKRHAKQTSSYLALFVDCMETPRLGELKLSDYALATLWDEEDDLWLVNQYAKGYSEFAKVVGVRLKSRCSHFLLVNEDADSIRFMHRTVLDFLKLPRMQNWLYSYSKRGAHHYAAYLAGEIIMELQTGDFGGPVYNMRRFVEVLSHRCWEMDKALFASPSLMTSVSLLSKQLGTAFDAWLGNKDACYVVDWRQSQGSYSCNDFKMQFLHDLWNKYWPCRDRIALVCLWVCAEDLDVVADQLQHIAQEIDDDDRLSLLTMMAVGDGYPRSTFSRLIDMLCTGNQAVARHGWRRYLHFLSYLTDLCESQKRKGDLSFDFGHGLDYSEALLRNGANPNATVSCHFAPSPLPHAQSALQIMQRLHAGIVFDREEPIDEYLAKNRKDTIDMLKEHGAVEQAVSDREEEQDEEWELHDFVRKQQQQQQLDEAYPSHETSSSVIVPIQLK